MLVLLALIAGTAFAMMLLVLYGNYLFEENRTRVTRRAAERRTPEAHGSKVGDVEWRTLVDPVEAANRARASKPFALAYARAMSSTHEDSRAA